MTGPILLINPNSAAATTAMMVGMARAAIGADPAIRGVTARRAPPMIVTPAALDAAEAEVVELGLRDGIGCSGVIVGAFGDPGVAALRERLAIPVIGLCEAAMIEAAAGGRRFGVATTTPELVARIDATAQALGLGALYAGTRLTQGDPVAVTHDPEALVEALAVAVRTLDAQDRAEAAIIGGGPLSQAAGTLAALLQIPVIAPVAAAARWMNRALAGAMAPGA